MLKILSMASGKKKRLNNEIFLAQSVKECLKDNQNYEIVASFRKLIIVCRISVLVYTN
jgi:hypothetical protein